MVTRFHFRRHNAYNTRSNRVRRVATPGGKVVLHHQKKKGTRPSCGDCHIPLNGLKAARPKERPRLRKRERTVARAYGGSRCHHCVRERIIRAFLIEEQRCVKEVILEKGKQKKDEVKVEVKKAPVSKKTAKN
ncbi:ribosomal protein RPL34 [Cardiosporidium cionae]|uniref:Ribosomal protein RPL34 n=1 Tax=Cardiosporidium cionae TaxID=476202 RepID=A0ABQ7J5K8_9APIC|nr:ribosomal protein RPL34 [Cardiosporidium cionae]|eukprot:KAF8819243.1 ribosomal protein RPL34 [Cardiosporidium cionae]